MKMHNLNEITVKAKDIMIGDVLTDKETGNLIGGSQIISVKKNRNRIELTTRFWEKITGNCETEITILRK
jgi:hypothetical protein